MKKEENLHAEIANFIAHPGDESEFNRLALASFAHQYEHCTPYRAYCLNSGFDPATITRWQDIPFVASGVFREFELTSYPAAETRYRFYTSGTSREQRGVHPYRDLSLYDLVIAHSAPRGLGLAAGEKATLRILGPSHSENPEHSLTYMFDTICRYFGDEASRFYWQDGALAWRELLADLQRDIAEGRPVRLLGTSLAYVHFFAACEAYDSNLHLQLPPGSYLLDTGGYKGQTQELTAYDFMAQCEKFLGIKESQHIREYGMSELTSHGYAAPGEDRFMFPPWIKILVVDPLTMAEVPRGETGVIAFFDLANIDTVSALVTSDLGVQDTAGGLRLLGRAALAPARGCSRAFA